MNHYQARITNSREGQRETEYGYLVWVAKFYSRTMQDSLWLVLSFHPGHAEGELSYLKAKEVLRLRHRGRTVWQIWPFPFTPPDGRSCFITEAAAASAIPHKTPTSNAQYVASGRVEGG